MSRSIKSILILSGLILILSGCDISKIPVNYRFSPGSLKTEITGHWTEVKLNSINIFNSSMPLSGELIAIQSDTLFLLTDTGLKDIRTSAINNALVYVYSNQSWKFGSATGLLYFPEIVAAFAYGEPGFLLLGIPWITLGTIMTMSEASNKSNLLSYPNNCQLQDLNKFARFPQGMPPGIDKSRLHLNTK